MDYRNSEETYSLKWDIAWVTERLTKAGWPMAAPFQRILEHIRQLHKEIDSLKPTALPPEPQPKAVVPVRKEVLCTKCWGQGKRLDIAAQRDITCSNCEGAGKINAWRIADVCSECRGVVYLPLEEFEYKRHTNYLECIASLGERLAKMENK